MKTFESSALYRKPEVRKKIRQLVKEVYFKGEQFEWFLKGLGVTKEQLSQEEIHKLEQFVKYAGEVLIIADLNKSGQKYKTLGDVSDALRRYAKKSASLGSHDLIHMVFACRLNSKPQNRSLKRSLIPEFLLREGSGVQKILEEFPAILWSTSRKNQPPFITLLQGKNQEIIQDFRDYFSSKDEKSAIDDLANKLLLIDRRNFKSLIIGYAELVFTALILINKRELKNLSLSFNTAKIRERKFLANIDSVRRIFMEELKVFGKSGGAAQSKNRKTLRLFFREAKIAFDEYDKNPKVIFEEFLRLSRPILKRLETITR